LPLIYTKSLQNEVYVTLWELTEDALFFLDRLDTNRFNLEELAAISHSLKQLEWLATRYCLQLLTEAVEVSHQGIRKDNDGKPHLNEATAHISMTHASRFVAVALHQTKSIGIDLEQLSEKLIRVSHKFLSEKEKPHAQRDTLKLCIYWSAKEALYKLNGRKGLAFRDQLQIEPFEDDSREIKGRIIDENSNVKECSIEVMKHQDYVLTVAL
jgi:4'-phosphopantetheinyl transferase